MRILATILLALLPVLIHAQEAIDSTSTCPHHELQTDSSQYHHCCDARGKAEVIDLRNMWQLLAFDFVDNSEEKLSFDIFTLGFFRDNEYSSELTKGYSLPGAVVRPVLVYEKNNGHSNRIIYDNIHKLRNIHLEVGAHALLFDGANKYPCYAYHDIGKWKGNQYQSGAHVLPWVRAQAEIGRFNVVMGDIYGGHGYSTPLYNYEQLLSADPEMGAQIVYEGRNVQYEAYVNWQSYQFEEDTHQEAFTVGVGAVPSMQGANGYFAFPVKVLAQHRGGEQDLPELSLGVQTIANASAGVNYARGFAHTPIKYMELQANILGCYQQKGELWPFESGLAYNAEGRMMLGKNVNVKVGDFYAPKNFVSILGNPFFSTLNYKTGATYTGLNTAYLMTEYTYEIARGYVLGANAELFKLNSTNLNEFNFSFGLYLRLCPSFKIK